MDFVHFLEFLDVLLITHCDQNEGTLEIVDLAATNAA